MAPAPKEHPDHPGYCTLYISEADLKKYNMKSGEGILDIKPFKFIPIATILDDIKELGKICLFEPLKAWFEQYKSLGEDVLFVYDGDEEKEVDMNFWWPNNKETFEKTKIDIGAVPGQEDAKKPDEEEKKRLEEEAAAQVEKERIEREVANIKTELDIRPWKSLGSEKEIADIAVPESRPRIRLQFSKTRREFALERLGEGGQRAHNNVHFTDIDSTDIQEVECRRHNVREYVLKTKQLDKGNQPAPETISSWAQTSWYRKLNRVSQYEPQTASNKEIQDSLNSEDMIAFLDRAVPLVEKVLINNETIDIFKNDLQVFEQDEQHFGTKTEAIKEVQTFVDLDWSRQKKIVKIDWVAGNNGLAGVACVENMNFDERVESSGRSLISTILIWNLLDVKLRAQMILTTPGNICDFAFNTCSKSFVVAGLETGQLVLWDIKKQWEELEEKIAEKQEAGALGKRSVIVIDDEEVGSTTASATCISFLEKSHERSIQNVMWLPQGHTVNKHGECRKTTEKTTSQIISVAGDGNMLFWDMFMGLEEDKWTPLLKVKLEGLNGPYGCVKMCYCAEITNIALVTETGYFILKKWTTSFKDETSKVVVEEKADSDERRATKDIVLKGHDMTCRTVQMSPHFPDIFLTVGDWTFRIWKHSLSEPLFVSTAAATYLSCGAWSPSRPAVVVTAKLDGSVDIWDLIDQTHMPVIMNSPISSMAITDLVFQPRCDPKRQLVAVADVQGNLRILEIPRNFSRPNAKEVAMMRAFYDRELLRINRRLKEKAKKPNVKAAHDEGDGKKKVLSKAEIDEQAEETYQSMLKKFKSQLGLKK